MLHRTVGSQMESRALWASSLATKTFITAVNAYVDESDYTATIQEFIDSVKPDDDAVIFTDIYGGSVFQKVMLLEPEKKGIVHVTGFNLAAVIETLIRTDPITPSLWIRLFKMLPA